MFDFDARFCESAIFGVVMDERVFLRTDEKSRGDFDAEYRARNGRENVTSYYELPARLIGDEAVRWARRAYDIALRSPTSRRKRRKRLKPRQPSPPLRLQVVGRFST